MPLPILSPHSDAMHAVEASWLAHIERRAATTPPPGRAASHASALAAERAILGPRRAGSMTAAAPA